MVQRLQYRRRHCYSTKSNVQRILKTPGGKLTYQTVKKRAAGPKCADKKCGTRLPGIPHLRPAEYKNTRLCKSKKTVHRAYGGALCGECVRQRIVRAFLVEEQKIVKRVLKLQAKGKK